MAASDRKISHFPFLQLLLLLELVKDTAALLAVWHCLEKNTSQRGSVGTNLFVSANLN